MKMSKREPQAHSVDSPCSRVIVTPADPNRCNPDMTSKQSATEPSFLQFIASV